MTAWRKIMVISPDATYRSILSSTLERLGWEVDTSNSPLDGARRSASLKPVAVVLEPSGRDQLEHEIKLTRKSAWLKNIPLFLTIETPNASEILSIAGIPQVFILNKYGRWGSSLVNYLDTTLKKHYL